MRRPRENKAVAKLLRETPKPDLESFSGDDLMDALTATEALRVESIVKAHFVVRELARRKISFRAVESHTGIPKSTLSGWHKQEAA